MRKCLIPNGDRGTITHCNVVFVEIMIQRTAFAGYGASKTSFGI